MAFQTYFPGHEPGTYRPYKTIGGWVISYLDHNNEIHPASSREEPYKHRQSAARRAKQLNDELNEKKRRPGRRHWHYQLVGRASITSTDLQEEIGKYEGKIQTFKIYIQDHAEQADCVYLPEINRMGIAWGADAQWADVDDIEQGIEMWANQPEEWEKRN